MKKLKIHMNNKTVEKYREILHLGLVVGVLKRCDSIRDQSNLFYGYNMLFNVDYYNGLIIYAITDDFLPHSGVDSIKNKDEFALIFNYKISSICNSYDVTEGWIHDGACIDKFNDLLTVIKRKNKEFKKEEFEQNKKTHKIDEKLLSKIFKKTK